MVSPLDRVQVRQDAARHIAAASYVKPSDVTAYTAGDIIANSLTAALVTPLIFDCGADSGRLLSCRCLLTPASGAVVLPAFDLLLFRPVTGVPFAAGAYPADNAALTIAAASQVHMVGAFTFGAGAWRNQAGATAAAGPWAWQSVAAAPQWAPFNLAGLGSQQLIGVLQAQNAWTPGAVVQTLDFVLGADLD